MNKISPLTLIISYIDMFCYFSIFSRLDSAALTDSVCLWFTGYSSVSAAVKLLMTALFLDTEENNFEVLICCTDEKINVES